MQAEAGRERCVLLDSGLRRHRGGAMSRRAGRLSAQVQASRPLALSLAAGRRTELMYASWPRNLRMMLPVDTSHRNTWRSPPHEANLPGGGGRGSWWAGSRAGRTSTPPTSSPYAPFAGIPAKKTKEGHAGAAIRQPSHAAAPGHQVPAPEPPAAHAAPASWHCSKPQPSPAATCLLLSEEMATSRTS